MIIELDNSKKPFFLSSRHLALDHLKKSLFEFIKKKHKFWKEIYETN
jgi:hypothetical protein